jgi:hypothetical protein
MIHPNASEVKFSKEGLEKAIEKLTRNSTIVDVDMGMRPFLLLVSNLHQEGSLYFDLKSILYGSLRGVIRCAA